MISAPRLTGTELLLLIERVSLACLVLVAESCFVYILYLEVLETELLTSCVVN